MWMTIKEGGIGAFGALGLGLLALMVGSLALLCLMFSRKTAYVLGLVTLVLAFTTAGVGLLGVSLGRRQTDQALEGVSDISKSQSERIRHEGYAESLSAAKVGFGSALLPLVLGAIAAFVGAFRKEDGPAGKRIAIAPATLKAKYRKE